MSTNRNTTVHAVALHPVLGWLSTCCGRPFGSLSPHDRWIRANLNGRPGEVTCRGLGRPRTLQDRIAVRCTDRDGSPRTFNLIELQLVFVVTGYAIAEWWTVLDLTREVRGEVEMIGSVEVRSGVLTASDRIGRQAYAWRLPAGSPRAEFADRWQRAEHLLAIGVALTRRCDNCGHTHEGSALAGICVGCPCPWQPRYMQVGQLPAGTISSG